MDVYSGSDPKETYLYIDFGDKIRNEELYRTNIFFRAANLNTECPLIQLNDHLFKGSYEDSVGTNIFFEEDEESTAIDHAMHLTFKITQFKTLTLRSVRIPSNLKNLSKPEYDIKINTSHNHTTLLKKLCDGSFTLEDGLKIVPKSKSSSLNRNITNDDSNNQTIEEDVSFHEPSDQLTNLNETVDCPSENNKENDRQTSTAEPSKPMVVRNANLTKKMEPEDPKPKKQIIDILSFKYEKLKRLAKIPTKRKKPLEEIAKCDSKYQKAYEYNSIKSQVIKPSDFFPIIKKKFNRETLVGAVDLDRSIIQGVIKPTFGYVHILTEEEKTKLLSLENLENLSMPARYWVLKSQWEHLESIMSTLPEDELSEKDEFGRTLKDTAKIYKRLSRVVHDIVQQNYSYNSDAESESSDG